ncbi:hypothetical protein [Methanoculleus chikugoensis]|uniref:hypothetical protein n=1 Tax=Methanoculleus chikugoensis TaxID=118126 RepID=UPI000AA5E01E|nr:hypothetical protein [Methanoculleus chikugoensis]
MAKNTGEGYRKGAVKGKSQFEHSGTYYKRDGDTGRIVSGKKSGGKYKGVSRE